MDAIQKVQRVTPEFQGQARGLVVLMCIGIVVNIVWELVKVVKESHTPPTELKFAIAGNADVDWGPMPWMAIKVESFGEEFGPQFTKSKTKLGDNPKLWEKFTCKPPLMTCSIPTVSVVSTSLVQKPSQNNLAILDMTNIHPGWSAGTPDLRLTLHANSSRPLFTFYCGDASTLAAALTTQDYTKMESSFKGHAIGKFSNDPPGCIRMFIEVEKGIVPTVGTCWGFPWSKGCTEDHYTMVFSAFSGEEPVTDYPVTFSDEQCESGQIHIQIILRNSVVRTIEPQSMCKRLKATFQQSLGSSLALMSSLFLFFFVRQYPPETQTPEEQMNEMLTLRGFDERPTYEEIFEIGSEGGEVLKELREKDDGQLAV